MVAVVLLILSWEKGWNLIAIADLLSFTLFSLFL